MLAYECNVVNFNFSNKGSQTITYNSSVESTGNILSAKSNYTLQMVGAKVITVAKAEHPNFGGLLKDCTVECTTDVVEKLGESKFGGATAELILGNIGAGSVSAVQQCGHCMTPIPLDKALELKCVASCVHGVEATAMLIDVGFDDLCLHH